MKICANCKELKEINLFYKKKQNKSGLDSYCKKCWQVKQRKKRGKNVVKSEYFTGTQLGRLIGNCRKRANIKKIEFDIDAQYVGELLHDFCKNNKHSWESNNPFKPSIDKIDNVKGYVKGNIQILWMIENYCKNIFTNEQVIEFCKLKLKL